MNPLTGKEAGRLFTDVAKFTSRVKKTEIVVCPPFLYLERLKKISRKIILGAQDAFWQDEGAYTGFISANMLYNAGVKYVILGHSERRALGENNNDVNKKIKAAFRAGLRPLVCVGETIRDENHGYFNAVKMQVEECLKGISKISISKVSLVYEPVWAISTTLNRRDATPTDSQEMAIFLRKILTDKFGSEAKKVRIVYGGSANEKNAYEFLKNGGVDGLLPGAASLNAKKFLEIIKICEALSR